MRGVHSDDADALYPDLKDVTPAGGEDAGGVPAEGDKGGGHGDGEDLDVLRLQNEKDRASSFPLQI